MIVGELTESTDLLVVGGGPGGYTAAIRAAQLGRAVRLVDRDDWHGLGGTCLQVGCIPSKTLIEFAGAADRQRRGVPGVRATPPELDMPAFQAHSGEVVDMLAKGVGGLLRGNGVETSTGSVSFLRPGEAVIAGGAGRPPVRLQYNDAIVATGSSPSALPDLPFDGARVVDSAGLLRVEAIPETLCVVGAGYIGLELGTAFAKLGTKVTLVEAADRVGGVLEPDVAGLLARRAEELGIALHLNALVTDLDEREVVITASDGSELRVGAERVCVVVGRLPNSAGLGLEALGARLNGQGHVEVDAARIAAPRVAAIGDITPGPALAHKATAEAVVAAEALSGGSAVFAPQAVPAVMFTDPEVALAGWTEEEAVENGLDVQVATIPLAAIGRAATVGERAGFTRLVAERGTGTIYGAQVVGPHATEVIAEATLAIEMAATLEDLSMTVHGHPTFAEGLTEAAELGLGRPLNVPALRR